MKTADEVDPGTSPASALEPSGLLAGLGENPGTIYISYWNEKHRRRE